MSGNTEREREERKRTSREWTSVLPQLFVLVVSAQGEMSEVRVLKATRGVERKEKGEKDGIGSFRENGEDEKENRGTGGVGDMRRRRWGISGKPTNTAVVFCVLLGFPLTMNQITHLCNLKQRERVKEREVS